MVLLEAEASPSAVDNDGWTPLHLSARWGLTDVTKVLLEAGVSPSAVDNDVIKPLVTIRQSNIILLKIHKRNVI